MTAQMVRNTILAVGMLLVATSATSASEQLSPGSPAEDTELSYGFGIVLRGNLFEVMRFKRWLDRIARVPKGIDTLWVISASRHQLTIEHSRYSVLSSGRTQAPMTMNLVNGVGEDVTIKFNAYIPDQGSHRVFDTLGRPIEFTALQNLYHELAHAMHKMTGTWLYFRSERSAIEEENIFRRQLAELEHGEFHKRFLIDGEAVCPSSGVQLAAYTGQELVCNLN
jgi:hypothetical protein